MVLRYFGKHFALNIVFKMLHKILNIQNGVLI